MDGVVFQPTRDSHLSVADADAASFLNQAINDMQHQTKWKKSTDPVGEKMEIGATFVGRPTTVQFRDPRDLMEGCPRIKQSNYSAMDAFPEKKKV